MSAISVHGISRWFGDVRAVHELSFEIEEGHIFGFIGPNGAGKSTTMRVMATLDLPSAGDCVVKGLSAIDDADGVRRLIGYMPDNYGSYPNMNVYEYLDFFARAYGLDPVRRRRAVDDVMEFCQLGGLRDKLVTVLSKGMKQRLCLGRCLIHDPEVLLLDEPSAGLDPRARIEFRDLLLLLKEQGKTIFVSSHILAELEELCDAVAIIELGEMVACGSISEVKHSAREARERLVQENQEAAHTLEIRLAADHPRLAEILAEQPEIAEVRVEHRYAAGRCRGDAATRSALLKRLLEAGLPICNFGTRDENLEDVFMHLTKGKVQ